MDAAGVKKEIAIQRPDIVTPMRKAIGAIDYYGDLKPIPIVKNLDARNFNIERLGPRYGVYEGFTGGGAVKQLSEIVKANPKGLYSNIINGRRSIWAKPVDDIEFNFFDLPSTELYKLVRRERDFLSTPGVYRQADARASAGALLKMISRGLNAGSGPDSFSRGMFPNYLDFVKNRRVFDSLSSGKRRVKIMRNEPDKNAIKTIKMIAPGEQINTAAISNQDEIAQLGYLMASKRKNHLLHGMSTRFFPKELFKGKNDLEQLKMIKEKDSKGNFIRPSPQFDPVTRTVFGPLGIGSAMTRHEVAHGLWETGNTAYRVAVIKRIHEMLKRHPEIMKIISKGKYMSIPSSLSELAAQTIASMGNSRSAKRFIEQSLQNVSPYVEKAKRLDPSNIDAVMINHLSKNYEMPLPISIAK
jgi:hypothetical protein